MAFLERRADICVEGAGRDVEARLDGDDEVVPQIGGSEALLDGVECRIASAENDVVLETGVRVRGHEGGPDLSLERREDGEVGRGLEGAESGCNEDRLLDAGVGGDRVHGEYASCSYEGRGRSGWLRLRERASG